MSNDCTCFEDGGWEICEECAAFDEDDNISGQLLKDFFK